MWHVHSQKKDNFLPLVKMRTFGGALYLSLGMIFGVRKMLMSGLVKPESIIIIINLAGGPVPIT